MIYTTHTTSTVTLRRRMAQTVLRLAEQARRTDLMLAARQVLEDLNNGLRPNSAAMELVRQRYAAIALG